MALDLQPVVRHARCTLRLRVSSDCAPSELLSWLFHCCGCRFGVGGWLVLAALTIGHASFLWYRGWAGHKSSSGGALVQTPDQSIRTDQTPPSNEVNSPVEKLSVEVNPTRTEPLETKMYNPLAEGLHYQCGSSDTFEPAPPPWKGCQTPLKCIAQVNPDRSVIVSWSQSAEDATVDSVVILATRQGSKRRAVTSRLPAARTHHTLTSTELGGAGRWGCLKPVSCVMNGASWAATSSRVSVRHTLSRDV